MTDISQSGIQNILFKVCDRPYCLWGVDLPKRNLKAINNIDSEYFEFLANLYYEQLKSEHKQKAALAIRAAYGHALETLFSLISATLQAPHCFYAWMLKYKPGDVPKIIKEIGDCHFNFYLSPAYRIEISSWKDFAMMIHLVQIKKENEDMAIKFSEFWREFSRDFLDEKFRSEYNSIKHGCRIKSGGFSMSVGLEDIPGVAVKKEKMKSLGGSEFGSSFFLAQEIKGNIIKGDPNFKTRKYSVNWNAESNVHALVLISYSIHNIKSFLQHINHVQEVSFVVPEEIEYFKKHLENNPKLLNCSIDLNVDDIRIKKKTRQEIEEIYRELQKTESND
ncbi:MAG TPA: hypothetical protein VMW16_14060 [Sedimentisphaerales bacterium]|nr:hypothetical protein [Sedimentisphaerales bacterium]